MRKQLIAILLFCSFCSVAQTIEKIDVGDDINVSLGKVNSLIKSEQTKVGNAIFLTNYNLALDGTTNDGIKIQQAIDDAAEGDVIEFPPGGSIKISTTVTITKRLTINGNGANITLDSNLPCFYLFERDGVTIQDFIFTGSGRNVSTKTLQTAITYVAGARHTIQNITCNLISGTGIMGINNFGESASLQQQGTSLSNIKLWFNNIGIAWMNRSEYNIATNIIAYENTIGIQDNSGNNILSGFSFEGNFTGYKMLSGGNVGHGSIANGSMNHHITYGLDIDANGTGVLINNVNFFQAFNYIRNGSKAVKFSNCQFDGLTTYAIEFSGSTSVSNSVDNCQWSNPSTDPKTKIIGSSSAKFTVRNLRRIDGEVFNFGSYSTTVLAAKTANYTVLSSDFERTLKGDATSGNITFSVLSAAGVDGMRIKFMKIDASGNTVSLDPSGSETVNGSSATRTLTAQYQYETWESNGTNWILLESSGGISDGGDATNADFTASVNTVYNLPAATLSTNRTITIPAGSDMDVIEIYNEEAGFTWNLTGSTVYQSDGTTAVTSLLAQTNYVIRKVSGKWKIKN